MKTRLLLCLVVLATLSPVAPARALANNFVVTLSAPVTEVEIGSGTESVRLSGKVTPAAPGKPVTLQRRTTEGEWKKVRSITLSSASTFKTAVGTTKPGVTTYRVVKPASAANAAGTSPERTVSVFRWRRLTDLPVRAQNSSTFITDATFGGRKYPRSILVQSSGEITFDVTDCDDLRVTVGRDDTSATLTSGSAVLESKFGPGGSGGTGPFYTQDLTDWGRVYSGDDVLSGDLLDLSATMSPGGPGARAVFVAPKVRCTS